MSDNLKKDDYQGLENNNVIPTQRVVKYTSEFISLKPILITYQ